MKYVKLFVLLVATLLLGNLIYVSTQQHNYIVSSSLSVIFFVVAYLGGDLVVKNFKLDGNTIEVNEEKNDNSKD
jgi:hypothetical protein